MSEAKVMRFNEIPRVDRGEGIYSTPLMVEATGAKVYSSGVTTFPPGAAIALHTHNTDEQVTLLEGEGIAEIEGRQEQVNPSTHVTRTYVETGEETGQFGKLSGG